MAARAGSALDSAKVMAGILALLVTEREDRLNASDQYKPPKTEVVLSSAGLNANEIASLMGKTPAAAQKAIQRGRK
jgi:DNA-directed RNA polymerase specialized sigma24 family protein